MELKWYNKNKTFSIKKQQNGEKGNGSSMKYRKTAYKYLGLLWKQIQKKGQEKIIEPFTFYGCIRMRAHIFQWLWIKFSASSSNAYRQWKGQKWKTSAFILALQIGKIKKKFYRPQYCVWNWCGRIADYYWTMSKVIWM